MHRPKVTQKIIHKRVVYLDGQFRRDNICQGADIERKIRSNLPAKEEEIADLQERFLNYILEKRGVRLCEKCDALNGYDTFYYQNGQVLCENCVNNFDEAEEL